MKPKGVKMVGKKGQSALEYLMTYGWAILIIIIVGGVLYYYGVFSPSKLVGESKVGFSKVQVDTWAVDATNDDIKFIFENRAGKQINITNVNVGGTSTPAAILMNSGSKSTGFETVDCPSINSGDAYKWDITITYCMPELDINCLTLLTSTGTLSGVA